MGFRVLFLIGEERTLVRTIVLGSDLTVRMVPIRMILRTSETFEQLCYVQNLREVSGTGIVVSFGAALCAEVQT